MSLVKPQAFGSVTGAKYLMLRANKNTADHIRHQVIVVH
jgi:hypothetical protein